MFLWLNRKNARISRFVRSCSVIYQLSNKNAEIPPNFGSKSISALIGLSTFSVSQQFQANRQQIDSKPATNIAKSAVVRVCACMCVRGGGRGET
jgi:hypothetical protein